MRGRPQVDSILGALVHESFGNLCYLESRLRQDYGGQAFALARRVAQGSTELNTASTQALIKPDVEHFLPGSIFFGGDKDEKESSNG